MAQPNLGGSNPFMPPLTRDVRLPVALGGFCLVALRDGQKWQAGLENHQLVFDGRIYWFSSQLELEIFAANPIRYVPALGSDCPVTYVETGRRVPGQLEYATLHAGRLVLFAGSEQREQYASNTDRYATADLVQGGICIVSAVDHQRELPGLPETAVFVDGLRYLFAGVHERGIFLSNRSRYGALHPLDGAEGGAEQQPSRHTTSGIGFRGIVQCSTPKSAPTRHFAIAPG